MIGIFLGIRVRGRLRRDPEAAAALGPKAAPHLVKALENPELRAAAAKALLKLGAKARPSLLKRLKSRKGVLRVIEVLGRLRPRSDATPLLQFLQDSSPKMRRVAARAIARQGGNLSFSALADVLADDDAGVRRVALSHLTTTADPRAIRQLVRIAAHGSEELSRIASARILEHGYLAVAPLVDCLRTTDEALRSTVAYLFDGLNDHDSLVIMSKALEEDDDRIVQPVREAFLRKGPEIAPILAPLAGHPDARVRRTALGLLARWETPSSPFATMAR